MQASCASRVGQHGLRHVLEADLAFALVREKAAARIDFDTYHVDSSLLRASGFPFSFPLGAADSFARPPTAV